MSMASNIQERRSAKRYRHPLQVSCMGTTTVSTDWSTSGLKFKDFTGRLPSQGEIVDLILSFKVKSIRVTIDCKAEVVRISPQERMFALHFCNINSPEHDLITEFARYGM
ncbi:MAG: PilZ domain-containing protein [Pseudomonadota bacterium]